MQLPEVPPTLTATKLQAGVESLPQELYDQVFELTFTSQPENHHIKIGVYKPPAELQVNRATRKTFAQDYYGRDTTWSYENPDVMVLWLRSLEDQTLKMLYDAELEGKARMTGLTRAKFFWVCFERCLRR